MGCLRMTPGASESRVVADAPKYLSGAPTLYDCASTIAAPSARHVAEGVCTCATNMCSSSICAASATTGGQRGGLATWLLPCVVGKMNRASGACVTADRDMGSEHRPTFALVKINHHQGDPCPAKSHSSKVKVINVQPDINMFCFAIATHLGPAVQSLARHGASHSKGSSTAEPSRERL